MAFFGFTMLHTRIMRSLADAAAVELKRALELRAQQDLNLVEVRCRFLGSPTSTDPLQCSDNPEMWLSPWESRSPLTFQ